MYTKRGSLRGRLALTAALTVAALPGSLAAQNRMEGVVTFRMQSNDGKVDTVTQTTKGRNVRLEDANKRGGAWIYDGDQKRMVMLDGTQKRAMVVTEQDAQQMRAMRDAMRQAHGQSAKSDSAKPSFHFTDTGKSETVAGVKCEVWKGYTETEGKRRDGEACLAEGVGFAPFAELASNPMFAPEASEWRRYRDLVGPNKGILKLVQTTGGTPTTVLEAIKVEQKSVPPDAFQPPAGYTVMNMGEMMRKAQQNMQEQMKQQGSAKPPSQ
ncbi:MAG TPA: DUF4412 domain-containing protein [Gemmatimonadales bacterium]|nr:DUF4412 domain-containing protein [Gemmatimonadales bacterium]